MLAIIGAGAYVINQSSITKTAPETTGVTSSPQFTTKLSPVEVEALKYMVEEEKLARDVYTALAQKYPDVKVFSNIAKSEQTHINAVKSLLDKYGIQAELKPPGEFNNPHLQELYKKLVDKGDKSLKDALEVGAAIEEIDIVDLQKWLRNVTNPDIQQVFEFLMRGSRNHLRAFVSVLQSMGVKYVPQYLDPKTYEEIISSPMETGGGNATGAGKQGPGGG